jgi:microsomal dipeptidase-like Zn-dependent dipeptidase
MANKLQNLKSIFAGILILVLMLIIVVFIFAPAVVDQKFNQLETHSPYRISEQAKQLHQSLFIGDWHADSLLWNRDLAKRHDYGHVDIPRLQEGNVALQMFTVVTKSPNGLNYEHNETDARDNITSIAILQRWPSATWKSLTARAVAQADRLHDLAQQNEQDLMLIVSKQKLAEFIEKRQTITRMLGALLGTEGSHALDGELSNIQVLFDKGFRMMSLHHFFDNKLGGSLHGASQEGLSQFGRDALVKMQALGIMIDVSHSSEKVVQDVLELSKNPLLVSHTGFQGHCQSPRNISDKLMKKIASKGGLIAVGYWEAAVCGTSPKDVAESIKYGVKLLGEGHVALGSDYDGAITAAFDTSELAVITQELLNVGLSEDQIRKVMGGNMLTFLQDNLP